MRKVFMVSYFYPPDPAIGSIRNLAVRKELSKEFEVEVFTKKIKGTPEEKGITRSVVFDKSVFGKIKRPSKQNAKPTTKKVLNFSISLKSKIINSFPFNFLIIEGGLLYVVNGFFYLLKQDKKNMVLYSSLLPLADHVICYVIKSFFPKVKWVADHRDFAFSYDTKNVLSLKAHKWIYGKIFSKADLNLSVSKGVSSFYNALNKEIDCKVLYNGLDINKVDTTSKKSSAYFEITYTGSLYKGRRDPSILFDSLRTIIDENPCAKNIVRLNYAGKNGDIWDLFVNKYSLNEISKNYGFISRSEAKAIQNRSSINLLLSWATNNNKGVLTGKFYEYLESNIPVLVIINGVYDKEFEEIVKSINAGYLTYNDSNKEDLKNYIEDRLNIKEKTKETRADYDFDYLKKFTWEYQVKTNLANTIKSWTK